MRVFPPAPILYREVITPFELAGERLEPGTGVFVCTHVLHHDPRSFPEPERFLPERFAPAARASIPPYAYLPFGVGPRTCIASRVATMQMVEAGTAIARACALRPCGGDRFVVERVG
jgi:cytochrome P450